MVNEPLSTHQQKKILNFGKNFLNNCLHFQDVTTLALGSQPRQGDARLRTKRKTRKSHHMLPGVASHAPGSAKSVREHSQVNSHVRNWSPKWTFEFSKRDCNDQNPSPWEVFYIIGNLLKHRCLKWACIAHLDIWNTSYGQKESWESNWQFDSRPLKVGNRPDF